MTFPLFYPTPETGDLGRNCSLPQTDDVFCYWKWVCLILSSVFMPECCNLYPFIAVSVDIPMYNEEGKRETAKEKKNQGEKGVQWFILVHTLWYVISQEALRQIRDSCFKIWLMVEFCSVILSQSLRLLRSYIVLCNTEKR